MEVSQHSPSPQQVHDAFAFAGHVKLPVGPPEQKYLRELDGEAVGDRDAVGDAEGDGDTGGLRQVPLFKQRDGEQQLPEIPPQQTSP